MLETRLCLSIAAQSVDIAANVGVSSTPTVALFTCDRYGAQASDFSATLDPADGSSPTACTITYNSPGSFIVTANLTYNTAGSYSPTINITDNTDYSTASATDSATVSLNPISVNASNLVFNE